MASADSVHNLLDKTVPYLKSRWRSDQQESRNSDSTDKGSGSSETKDKDKKEDSKKVVPYVQYYGLMLDPRLESEELGAYGTLPTGSLLVWVDTMYTTPETILSRTSGRWENMHKTLSLFPSSLLQDGYMRFKIFGIDESRRESLKWPHSHGEFDEFQYWSESFLWGGDSETEDLRIKCNE